MKIECSLHINVAPLSVTARMLDPSVQRAALVCKNENVNNGLVRNTSPSTYPWATGRTTAWKIHCCICRIQVHIIRDTAVAAVCYVIWAWSATFVHAPWRYPQRTTIAPHSKRCSTSEQHSTRARVGWWRELLTYIFFKSQRDLFFCCWVYFQYFCGYRFF